MTINIVFFAGNGATISNVHDWANSAEEQNKDLEVKPYAWPTGASVFNPLSSFKGSPEIAKEINGFKDETYIIGHSSGCAIANEVVSLITKGPLTHLICLDGFVPYAHQRELPTTQIWSAMHNGHLSRNFTALKGFKNFHVFDPPSGVTSEWGLHYSLVNLNTNNDTGIINGYKDCKANLCWLPPL